MFRNMKAKEFLARIITWWSLALLCIGTGVCAPIPQEITKTVVFIYNGPDGTPAQADGTGFFVSIPSPPVPGRLWGYLVTAKHIVVTDKNDLNSPLLSNLWVRVNMKSGGTSMYKLDLITSGNNQTLFFNSDPTVDIALFSIGRFDKDKMDSVFLPEDMLVSTDDFQKLNIGVGTDMFFTGMFTGFLGERKSYPVVRFGKLAMIPDEKVTFSKTASEGYLMEAFSFGGNSGSPVFFYPSADNTPGALILGPRPIKIAGLMRGFFGDYEPIQLAQTSTSAPGQTIPVSNGNTGIAFVVPAKFISEVLHSPVLENRRKNKP